MNCKYIIHVLGSYMEPGIFLCCANLFNKCEVEFVHAASIEHNISQFSVDVDSLFDNGMVEETSYHTYKSIERTEQF